MKLIVFVIFVLACALFAQPGAYPDFETLKNDLEEIVKSNPTLIQMESQGTTLGGREILMLKFGAGEQDKKPAILLVGGVSGSDLAGTDIIMQFIKSGVTNYGKNDIITSMI